MPRVPIRSLLGERVGVSGLLLIQTSLHAENFAVSRLKRKDYSLSLGGSLIIPLQSTIGQMRNAAKWRIVLTEW